MMESRLVERWRLRRALTRRHRPLWRRTALGRRRHPADEFVLVPPEIGAADPSFADELKSGYLGLAGSSIAVGRSSPFSSSGTPDAWLAELHRFTWLKHLTADRTPFARDRARAYVNAWIAETSRGDPVAWRIDVLARRIIAWINNAPLILDATDAVDFDRVMKSLNRQLIVLGDACSGASPSRLEGLIALVLADLAIKDQESHLVRAERELMAELGRQVLSDGGHIGRNPEATLDLLLDLLPLRQTYVARARELPDRLGESIERMIAFLGHVRLGDGCLATFNGAARRRLEDVATVLLYATEVKSSPGIVAASRYMRAEAGGMTLVMDCGSAPPIEHAATAGAGCLSFELSDVATILFAHQGPSRGSRAGARGIAPWRTTMAHNTLTIAEQSSARFINFPDAGPGGSGWHGLTGPRAVTVSASATSEGQTIEASHDGFVAAYDLRHTRVISLAVDGSSVTGRDLLGARSGVLRLKQDVPISVYFHIHSEVAAVLGGDANTVELRSPDDRRWRYSAEGCEVRLETRESETAQRVQQIVLRLACHGEVTVSWRLERISHA